MRVHGVIESLIVHMHRAKESVASTRRLLKRKEVSARQDPVDNARSSDCFPCDVVEKRSVKAESQCTANALEARLLETEARLHGFFLRGLDGDSQAYHWFLQLLSKHLRSYVARRLARWPDEVEDLVQECLLAIHSQRHTYRRDQSLTAWIHAIARYKSIDLLRAKSARDVLHDPLDDDLMLFAEATEAAYDAKRDVETLLAELPEHVRMLIEQVKLKGHSVTEAAHLMNMTESAVKVSIHRGLRSMAAKMRKKSDAKR